MHSRFDLCHKKKFILKHMGVKLESSEGCWFSLSFDNGSWLCVSLAFHLIFDGWRLFGMCSLLQIPKRVKET